MNCQFYIILILLVPGIKGAAQSGSYSCGFDRTEINSDLTYSEVKRLHEISSFENRSTMTIPVVFHIVLSDNSDRISDEIILRQLDYLNQDFRGRNPDQSKVPVEFKKLAGQSNIRFCLASEDPFGNPAVGIERMTTPVEQIGIRNELYYTAKGGDDAWDTERYLNIWIADTGGDITGLGSAPGQRNKYEDGVVIHSELFNSDYPCRTLTHEVGHYLGLFHMWNADGSCEDRDFVEDTPVQAHPYYGCPQKKRMTCYSSDMYMNYMDYTNWDCMYFFTKGQMDRMRAILLQYRARLLDSPADCDPHFAKPDFLVYPNPSIDRKIGLQFTNDGQAFLNIKVYSVEGKLIYSQKHWQNEKLFLNLPSFRAGVYLISVNGRVKKVVFL